MNVCDLDVELWRLIRAAFNKISLFDYNSIHDLSLDRCESDWFLSKI